MKNIKRRKNAVTIAVEKPSPIDLIKNIAPLSVEGWLGITEKKGLRDTEIYLGGLLAET